MSFSFSLKNKKSTKKKKLLLINKNIFNDNSIESNAKNDHDHVQVEDITELDDQTFNKIDHQSLKKKELIIPLINKMTWTKSTTSSNQNTKLLNNDDKLLNISKNNDSDNKKFIPLLMQNQIPGIKENWSESKKIEHDLSYRPDAPDFNTYDEISISDFGKAMLRGMGWEKGKPIGNTFKAVTKLTNFQIRAKNIGIGAQEQIIENEKVITEKQSKIDNNNENDDKKNSHYDPIIKKRKLDY